MKVVLVGPKGNFRKVFFFLILGTVLWAIFEDDLRLEVAAV